jgi:hypothetical protein
MSEKIKETRRPILTRKEQTLLAFILALLVIGGIVRKVRMDWHTSGSVIVQNPDQNHGQN